jgi:hypothetical protein
MTTSREIRDAKPVSEFTEEDFAAYDQYIEVPFFWGTYQRVKAWRKRRALAKHAADGDPLAAGEVAEGDSTI